MAHSLKAAMGKVKVTPEERAPLQGYDPEVYVADPQKDLLDDLYARILILDDGQTRSVVVGCDCCLTNETNSRVADPGGRMGQYREFRNTFPEGTRKSWGEAAGVPEENVSVHATHTHTAPAHFSEYYTLTVTEKIKALAAQLQPVMLQISTGESKISVYRRPTLYADYSVPIDQTLLVASFIKEDGSPLGYLVNFAVHPTSLRNPMSRISSDIVGLAMTNIEQEMGEGFICLFIQGFSGDICPAYGDNGPKGDTYPDVLKGARHFSEDIKKTLESRQALDLVVIKTVQKIVTIPTKEGFYTPSLTVTILGISVGDLGLLSISGEVFNGYVEKIRSVSPFKHTLLSGVANGYSGYIPTYKAYYDGLGGYEMNTTPYTDAIEQIVFDGAREVLLALKDPHT
jgi:hypothetical protein